MTKSVASATGDGLAPSPCGATSEVKLERMRFLSTKAGVNWYMGVRMVPPVVAKGSVE
jgi:hypothetical protein